MVESSPTNAHEYSVSEISGALKRSVEDRFGHVRVRGEISGFKRAASGHLYLDLKDEKAVLNTVCWKGVAAKLPFAPEDGLEVLVTGKLTTYPGRSNYQLVVERMEPAGAGALMALLEKRKKQLAAEGLFDPARKRPLPYLPRTIGVVTSPTGSVIRDILHRIEERFPSQVLVWPVRVQGDGAAEEIAAAIRGFNALTNAPDILIVARGGGSVEDLWCFNEECVVRATAESSIPLISAVGHETDTTLIDFASDKRAPTPTAAAEFALPVHRDLLAHLRQQHQRLDLTIMKRLDYFRERVQQLARAIPAPQTTLAHMSQRLDDWSERLATALPTRVTQQEEKLMQYAARLTPRLVTQRLEQLKEKLHYTSTPLNAHIMQRLNDHTQKLAYAGGLFDSLNYKQVLKRGFAIVRDAKGGIVRSAANAGDAAVIQFHDGESPLTVPAKTKKPKAKPDAADQESLF